MRRRGGEKITLRWEDKGKELGKNGWERKRIYMKRIAIR